MTNYVSLLLETDAAKRRLAELFESRTLRAADHRSIAIVPRDRSRPAGTAVEEINNTFQEHRCTRTPVGSRTRTAIPTIEQGQTKRDLTLSSFMLALVLVGFLVAAHTDRPLLASHRTHSFGRPAYRKAIFATACDPAGGLLMFFKRNR